MCDLSSSLTELDAYYTADVLSEPPLGANSDLTEFPYTSSPRFCPYKESRSFCYYNLFFFFFLNQHDVIVETFHKFGTDKMLYRLFRCMFKQVSSGKQLIHNWRTHTHTHWWAMKKVHVYHGTIDYYYILQLNNRKLMTFFINYISTLFISS